jgi:signal transduction histidine kinase
VDSVLGIAREVTERKRVEQLGRDQSFRREAAREEERKYIARELHDELGQLLSALRLEVSVVRLRFGQSNPAIGERTASMLALVDSIIRLQRDLVSSLRPAVLDLGIGPALEWLVGEFTERSGVICRLQLSEALVALDADQTTMVFRIVQESLTNVARHARASRVDVALQRRPDGYLLTVQDDGKGFDLLAARNPKSLGLIGLHERAQMLGGRLDLRSGANAGVTIAVAFPAAIVGRKRA